MRKKWFWIFVIGLFCLTVSIMVVRIYHRLFQTDDRKIVLQTSTADHRTIEQAMRQLWESHTPTNKEEPVQYREFDKELPTTIQSLHPSYVHVWTNGVRIELGGDWDSYGFETVWPDAGGDPDRIIWKDTEASKELLPGFWFYAARGLNK